MWSVATSPELHHSTYPMSIKHIQHIFFDLDHTLWDFETNSRIAFEQMFIVRDLEQIIRASLEPFHKAYMVHNQRHWDLYSQGLISQSDLRWKRIYETLKDFDLDDVELAKSLGSTYLDILPHGKNLFPGTRELLLYLQGKKYKLHIVSNGFEHTQYKKLFHSGIKEYFSNIITSEASNYIKPDKLIFEYAANKSAASLNQCIMIGDSPEADLKGAYNAGIPSIYVDHLNVDTEVPHTFRVKELREIEGIL